jgi:hypothetical protein
MTTTSVRGTPARTVRRGTGKGVRSAGALVSTAFLVVVTAGATPAVASLGAGSPAAGTECGSTIVWGWPDGAVGPAYPGQRFGVHLPPQCRGPVLEGLDA